MCVDRGIFLWFMFNYLLWGVLVFFDKGGGFIYLESCGVFVFCCLVGEIFVSEVK